MAVPKDKDTSVPKAEVPAGATGSQRKGHMCGHDKDRGRIQRQDSSVVRRTGAEGPGWLPLAPCVTFVPRCPPQDS